MAISLIFYEKPKSAGKQKAIELVSGIPHQLKDGKYFIKSDIVTPELKKIVSLAFYWKTTELFINEKEINTKEFQQIFGCYQGSSCNGACYWYFGKYYNYIRDAIRGYWVDADNLKNCPFLEYKENNEFHFDREAFNQYTAEISEILQFCDYFNIGLTYEKFNEIPEYFKLINNGNIENDYDEDFDKGIIPNEELLKKFDKSNLPIQYSINNSIIFACVSKKSENNVMFKIKLLSFNPVDFSEIDNVEKIEDFEENGVLYLLKCDIINLSKFELDFEDIRRSLLIADEDDFEYKIFYDYEMFYNTDFGEKFGLKRTRISHFRPKIGSVEILREQLLTRLRFLF